MKPRDQRYSDADDVSFVCSPQATEVTLEYPDWAIAVLSGLILFAIMPVLLGYLHATLRSRAKQRARDREAVTYSRCATE